MKRPSSFRRVRWGTSPESTSASKPFPTSMSRTRSAARRVFVNTRLRFGSMRRMSPTSTLSFSSTAVW